jgi:hypothetical protein
VAKSHHPQTISAHKESESFAAGLGEAELQGGLLDEQGFAELVAADEGFHGAVAGKEVLNFAILIDALHVDEDRAGNHLQVGCIDDAIALEAFGLFAVKQSEDDAARPQYFSERRNGLPGELRLEIIEQVPKQNGVERRRGILQVGLEKALGACGGSHATWSLLR